MSIPDPNREIDDDIDQRLEKRSDVSYTLATNGYPNTLVLSRERVISMSHNHLSLITYLEDHGPCTVDDIVAQWSVESDERVFKDSVEDTISTLNKLGVTDQDGDVVDLQYDHVVVPLV